MFKVFFAFLIGVLSAVFVFISFDKMKKSTTQDSEIENGDIIISQIEIAKRFEAGEGFNLLDLPNVSGIKLLSWVYSPNSSCNIEFEVSSGFSKNNNGSTYSAKVMATDFSSVEAKIECSKLAMEKVLPIILRGAFSGIVKAKIFDDGTILKKFSYQEIVDAEAKNLPLTFDSGFVIEGLNIGILSSPKKFELYITDCKNTKCDD